MSVATGDTARTIAAADRDTYEDWKLNEIRRYEETGATYWWTRKHVARHTHRGTSGPQDAFAGPMWLARKGLTAEALEWFDVLGNPRYTFADWQDLRRAERAAEADRLREGAEGAALASLEYWRIMNDERGQTIAAAREGGATWAEIMAATGLSRMTCHKLHEAFLTPADTPADAPVDEDETARRYGYRDAADWRASEFAF